MLQPTPTYKLYRSLKISSTFSLQCAVPRQDHKYRHSCRCRHTPNKPIHLQSSHRHMRENNKQYQKLCGTGSSPRLEINTASSGKANQLQHSHHHHHCTDTATRPTPPLTPVLVILLLFFTSLKEGLIWIRNTRTLIV